MLMDDERKERDICPYCGEWNYALPTLYTTIVVNDTGFEHYASFSVTKYKCTRCGAVWKERWDEK